jgi:hypothetical protein
MLACLSTRVSIVSSVGKDASGTVMRPRHLLPIQLVFGDEREAPERQHVNKSEFSE